jgi:hypothetical protein
MSQAVQLLSRPTNFAVVQLPDRLHPGVVVQGDTLNGIVNQLSRMSELLLTNQVDELSAELADLTETFSDARRHYEATCGARGIALPYPKAST